MGPSEGDVSSTSDENSAQDELASGAVDPRISSSPPDALRSDPPVAIGTPCAGCGAAIVDSYFEVNGRPTCPACRAALSGNLLLAAVAGLVTGAACTGSYYLVWQLTDIRFHLIAVIAGVAVGNVVRGRAKHGAPLLRRWLAVAITYLSVVATYVHSVDEQAEAASLWEVLRASLLLPFGMVYQGRNIVTLVLLAFGLHEAWQFSKRPTMHLAGPFHAI